MATSTYLSYNGFSDFYNVRIGRYEHVSDAGQDKPGRGPTRHVIEGDAIVTFTGNTTDSIQTKIDTLTAKLNRNGKALIVRTNDGTDAKTFVNVESDDKTGPYPNIRITEIIGANNVALVQWSFEWFATIQGDSQLSQILEFVCLSSFEIDAVGMTTITRAGHVTLRKSSASAPSSVSGIPTTSATPTAVTTYPGGYATTWNRSDSVQDYPHTSGGSNPSFVFPEQYRRMVAGNLYPGFRRVSQQYATDESRTRMVFSVVDRESPRGLPAPARMSSVNYSYERSIGVGDSTAMGMKRFSAVVSGPTNVAPADLLILAIRLSQKRIFWSRTLQGSTYYSADLIQRIRVSEVEMTEQNCIEFEVDAIGTADLGSGIGASGATAIQSGKPYSVPNFLGNILAALAITPKTESGSGSTDVTFTFSSAVQSDAYGEFGVYRITPSWYDPEQDPTARTWTTTQVLASADKLDAVYIFPNAIFDSHFSAAFTSDTQKLPLGRDNAKHRRDDASGPGTDSANAYQTSPYLHIESVERRSTQTNIVPVPSQSLTGADLKFQTRKPFTVVHQKATMVRLNASPSREFLSKDPGAVILHEEFITHGGNSDGVNNRMMAATHERIYTIADDGTTAKNFYTSGGYRQFWPNKTANSDSFVASDSQTTGDVNLPKLATRDPVNGDPTFKYVFGSPEDWA